MALWVGDIFGLNPYHPSAHWSPGHVAASASRRARRLSGHMGEIPLAVKSSFHSRARVTMVGGRSVDAA